MPRLKIVSSAGKQTSAKKRKGSKPAEVSGGAKEPAPSGRSTRTSRKANETAPAPSPEPAPVAEYNIRLEGRSQPADPSSLPGSTGRSTSRSKTCTTFTPALDVITGAPTLDKLRAKVEKYLLDSTKEDMFYEDVVVAVRVDKSINFHKPVKVTTKRDFELLHQALEERPNTTMVVEIDWFVKAAAPAAALDSAGSATSPTSSAASMLSNSSTSSKKRRTTGSTATEAASERAPGQQVLDEINFHAGQLRGFYDICDKCKKTKNKDALCFIEPGTTRHYYLTHHHITTWADAIRQGKASYASPPKVMLDNFLDAPATPRGMHAARSLMAGTSQGLDWQGSPTAAGPSGSQTTTFDNHVPIVIRDSPDPTAARTPFGDVTNASTAAAINGPDWPLVEFATRKHERHRTLAELLVTHKIGDMHLLARAHRMKATHTLKLTPIEEVIISGWIEEWEMMTMSYEEWKAHQAATAEKAPSPTGPALT